MRLKSSLLQRVDVTESFEQNLWKRSMDVVARIQKTLYLSKVWEIERWCMWTFLIPPLISMSTKWIWFNVPNVDGNWEDSSSIPCCGLSTVKPSGKMNYISLPVSHKGNDKDLWETLVRNSRRDQTVVIVDNIRSQLWFYYPFVLPLWMNNDSEKCMGQRQTGSYPTSSELILRVK